MLDIVDDSKSVFPVKTQFRILGLNSDFLLISTRIHAEYGNIETRR